MGEAVSAKRYDRLRSYFQNVDMRKVVWLFFILSVVIRTYLNGFLKHAETYLDEWYYLQQAYDIAKGNGFSAIYGQEFPTYRWFYSFLIAPACLIENLSVRFYFIAFINSIILSSSIFPIWFMAKELLRKKSTQICALLIFLTLPELNIGVTFMADIAFFALATWLIWLSFKIIRWRYITNRQRLCTFVIYVSFCMLSILTKQTGVFFFVLLAIILFWILMESLFYRKLSSNSDAVSLKDKIKLKHYTKKSVKLIFMYVFVVALIFLFGKLLFEKLRLAAKVQTVIGTFDTMFNEPGFKSVIFNYFVNIMLCFGILPWPFLVLSLKSFKREELILFISLVVLVLMCLAGAIPQTYKSFRYGESGLTRYIGRYFSFTFVPFILFYLAAIERKDNTGFSKLFVFGVAFFCIVGFLIVWFLYPGNKFGSITDHAILCWAIDIKSNPAVALLLLHALVVLTFVMIYHSKEFLLVFMVLWLAAQGYNNITSFSIYRSAYQINSADSILILRDYVSTHRNDNFLLVGDVNLQDRSARYGDSCVDQTNVYRSTPSEFNADWNVNSETRDPLVSNISAYYRDYLWWQYKLPTVEYRFLILSSTDASVPSGDVEHIPLGEDSWYTLYKINDTHNLPTLLSLRDIGPTEDGDSRTYILPVNAGYFRAQRPDENGLPSFVSSGEPGYLFIGPYLKGNGNEQPTLEPGFYTITLRYQVEGSGVSEAEIGYIELCGSEQEMLSEYLTPVYAGESEALIYLPVSDPIENFEMRFFANVEGVRVTEIEMVAEP